MPVVPVAGAVLIASILGGPVCFIAGLKLGAFAALGGGIMGYTTGKMLEEHGETQNMLKSEYQEADSRTKDRTRKKRVLRRIEEWEKFEANCNKLKEKQTSCKNRSGSTGDVLLRNKEPGVTDPLTGLEASFTLEEKILLWRREEGSKRSSLVEQETGIRRPSYLLARRVSLPALVEETEEEDTTVSASTKRRSKSIDSSVII